MSISNDLLMTLSDEEGDNVMTDMTVRSLAMSNVNTVKNTTAAKTTIATATATPANGKKATNNTTTTVTAKEATKKAKKQKKKNKKNNDVTGTANTEEDEENENQNEEFVLAADAIFSSDALRVRNQNQKSDFDQNPFISNPQQFGSLPSNQWLQDKISDHISMSKFYKERRRERGEQVSDDEDDENWVIDDEAEEDEEGEIDESDSEDENDESSEDDSEEEMDDGDEDEVKEDSDAEPKEEDKPSTKGAGKPSKVDNTTDSSASTTKTSSSISESIPTASVHASFSSLKLLRPLLVALSAMQFTTPTPVQSEVIPLALTGKDLLVNAKTGSGKTLAFLLPIFQRILMSNDRHSHSKALILTPTREIATQIYAITREFSAYTSLTSTVLIGGVSEKVQQTELRSSPSIIIATPGRLIDHLRNSLNFHLEHIEVVCLDEADRLLEMGFFDELKEILKYLPKARQTMLFSATLPSDISTLMQKKPSKAPSRKSAPADNDSANKDAHISSLIELSLQSPLQVNVDPSQTLVSSLIQEFIRLKAKSTSPISFNEIAQREAILFSLLARKSIQSQKVLVFTPSKIECHRLFLLASFFSIKCMELNGNLTQLQRLEAIEYFQSPENGINVLFATDLAARGIDIPSISIVINLNLPRLKSLYVHRVGRTARAGLTGRAISIIGERDRKTLKELLKSEKKQIISTSKDENESEPNDKKKKASKKKAVTAVLSSRIQSRVIPSELITKWGERIMSKQKDLKEIIASERTEREQRKAEMEMNKVSNKIIYADDIANRPAKTWFQTHKEKLSAKARSERNFDDPNEEEKKVKLSSKERKKLEDEEMKSKAKKEQVKNDFNLGKLAKRKALKKVTSNRAEDSLPKVDYVNPEDLSLAPKISSLKKRKRSDKDTDSKQSFKKKSKTMFADTENTSKRFSEQTREMERRKSVAAANSKSKKPGKPGKSGFKSKGKHKRR